MLVFDEAHNIMETICSLNTVTITFKILNIAHQKIGEYLSKYGNRLAPKNAKTIKDIAAIAENFKKYLSKCY